jgi:hypothetical protein
MVRGATRKICSAYLRPYYAFMSEEGSPAGMQQFPRRKFFYDVMVNVTGNLFAAPVIYIVGASAGLFPKTHLAIAVAAATIAATISLSLLISGFRGLVDVKAPMQKEKRAVVTWSAGFMGLGLAVLSIPLQKVVLGDGAMALGFLGVVLLGSGIFFLVDSREVWFRQPEPTDE